LLTKAITSVKEVFVAIFQMHLEAVADGAGLADIDHRFAALVLSEQEVDGGAVGRKLWKLSSRERGQMRAMPVQPTISAVRILWATASRRNSLTLTGR
jgi:hypothetical protein